MAASLPWRGTRVGRRPGGRARPFVRFFGAVALAKQASNLPRGRRRPHPARPRPARWAASAAAMTSFTGTPFSRASRAQSSYSG